MEPPLAYMPVAVPALLNLPFCQEAGRSCCSSSCLCNRPCFALPVGAQGVPSHSAGSVDVPRPVSLDQELNQGPVQCPAEGLSGLLQVEHSLLLQPSFWAGEGQAGEGAGAKEVTNARGFCGVQPRL
eukprot:3265531-Rhodomonas_salina.1